ncbi:hypothetical protein HYU11_03335 [Candidatus Woesearchaeota archaeon]|nr:hypothetical protein [Candidatus Woesearchaeota archaeon]
MQQNFQETQQTEQSLRGLRTLEERYSNLVRRIQVDEQNSLSSGKKVNSEIKAINLEIAEIKKGLESINAKIDIIAKELSTLSKKEEVDVLKKYLNLWEPLNFVTHNEVEKIVREAVDSGNKQNL